MTIRNNYCPTCQDYCRDHPQICSVCGSTLEAPPVDPPRPVSAADPASPRLSLTARRQRPHSVEIGRINHELGGIIQNLRSRISDTASQQEQLLLQLHQLLVQHDVSVLGPAPKPAVGPDELAALPRIKLTSSSAVLRHCTFKVFDGNTVLLECNAIPAEFSICENLSFETIPLQLDSDVTTECAATDAAASALFAMRDGKTKFANMAMDAVKKRFHALIIGNNLDSPWPYYMKASAYATKTAVVMISMQDAKRVLQLKDSTRNTLTCSLQQIAVDGCVICTESMQPGQTVIQLPACAHFFHEECILPWLQDHSATCPYCRQSILPQQQQQQHQSSSTTSADLIYYG